MEWALKRKILYTLSFVAFMVLVSAYPVYKTTHKAPTCFDQKQNGDEMGIDCGGKCLLFCAPQIKEPNVVWAKAFLVTNGHYDVGAYIENLNTNAGLKAARYTMRVYDTDGKVVREQKNTVELPPASAVLLFGTNLILDTPPDHVEVVFEPSNSTEWVKARLTDSLITTKDQTLKNTDTKPRFDVTLINNDLVNDVGTMSIGAIIYNAARHPVAISRTYVDGVQRGGEQSIFFTWPHRFTKNPRGAMCTTPIDTILVFDRSGSMNQGRKTPHEPLTTAKNAANAYVDAADITDKVGLVSFATTVSSPIDQELSSDHELVRAKVSAIAIEKGSTQNTNLGDALKSAIEELRSVRHTKDAKQVVVALTDGVANYPLDPKDPTNKNYAEEYAVGQADIARTEKIKVYTIGLGKDLNEAFLKDRIATDSAHYFNAPTAKDLQSVYKTISETVCKPENFITELVITPRAIFSQ